MRKFWLVFGAVTTVVASSVYASYAMSEHAPEYIRLAEKKTNNLLQSLYGPGQCLARQQPDGIWMMNCAYDKGATVATYSVLPPQNASHAIVGQYYLEARNQLAVDSAHRGLGQFLEVDTDKFTGS